MRLLVTGATGLVGRRLVVDRLGRGDEIVIVSRDSARAASAFAAQANPRVEVVEGNPAAPGTWQQRVDGCDAVVHLAGAGIADRRWSKQYKQVLEASRVDGTHQVVEAIKAARRKPAVLISASATGYYGDPGAKAVEEDAPAGRDFLAQLCLKWEKQAHRASAEGVRVVTMRAGMVLDERGGALKKLLPPFRLFMGGPLGSGRQYVPWIHWRDLVGMFHLALSDADLSGPMNAVAPNPVTNHRFSHTLGQVLDRPSWLPVPPPVLRLAIGELARFAMMSQRVLPATALRRGFIFLYPELIQALEALLRHQMPGAAPPGGSVAPPAPRRAAPDPSRPVRLIVLAVDGVLLNGDGRLDKGTVEACRKAVGRGCAIVLASAQGPRFTASLMRSLDIIGPTINCNGALIWNPIDHRAQFHEPLAGELVREISDRARAIDGEIALRLQVLDRCYADRAMHVAGAGEEPDYVGPLDNWIDAPATMLGIIAAPAILDAIVADVRRHFGAERQVALHRPEPNVLQVAHARADKAVAVQRIAGRRSIPQEQIMAIGCGAEDQAMVEWAGIGVAVENALPRTRSLAEVIVPSNHDLGVARAIHTYVLGSPPEGA